ncbi:MAG: efflux RND transporter periplasmic adaptor subunit [Kiritimatiellia bacterium]|nr:efflux RND transporter periplasmic adaptor subunit [Kiritimatiellia bacterium]
MKNRTGTGHWIWAGLILIALTAVVLMALYGKKKEKEEAPTQERPVPIRTLQIEPRVILRRMEITGILKPKADIRLAVEHPGVIDSVPVDKGQLVRAGDVLLHLNQDLTRIAAEEARIQSAEADRDLERWRPLLDSGAVSLRDFQAVETRAQLARAAVERAETFLSKRVLRSPSDGWIEDRYFEPGDFAREGDPAFRLLDVSSLKLAFDIPESELQHLQFDRPIRFRLDAFDGESFAGHLGFLSQQAARENNSFAAELDVDNADRRLRPGLIARVELELAPLPEAVAIPIHAVVPQRGKHVVFVVSNGRAERRQVRILEFSKTEAILAEGLQAGENLIVEGHRNLMDGQPVEVLEPETPGSASSEGEPES